MKRLILMTTAAAVALWGNAVMAQTPSPAPTANQSKVQKRDRTHVPDSGGAQAQNKEQQNKGSNGQQAAKGKYGPADSSGNKGAPPNDGTGYGAKSGNQSGPADGTGSRQGDWQSGQRGRSGSVGRGRSGGSGGRR